MGWLADKAKQAVWNYAEEKVKNTLQNTVDDTKGRMDDYVAQIAGEFDQWVSNRTGIEVNMTDYNRETQTTTLSAGMEDGMDQAQDGVVKSAVNSLGKKLDDKALKNIDSALKNSGVGKQLLNFTGSEGVEQFTEKTAKNLAEKGAKVVTKAVGEKAGKAVAEKGAVFLAKKLARCVPGVGLITGGAIEYYEYCQEWGDMKEQYGPQTSEWLASQGIDVAPEDIQAKHLKQYAEQNPIIRKEINAMRTDMAARTAAGGFGIFGMAAEVGYDVVDMALGSRSAHEVMDDMAAQQAAGEQVTSQDVMEMVNDAYSGEPGKTTKDLSGEQKEAFEQAAQHYADMLNSGNLQAYDMLREVGDGNFHNRVDTQMELNTISQQMAASMTTTACDDTEVEYHYASTPEERQADMKQAGEALSMALDECSVEQQNPTLASLPKNPNMQKQENTSITM